jgi:hypothetical protein
LERKSLFHHANKAAAEAQSLVESIGSADTTGESFHATGIGRLFRFESLRRGVQFLRAMLLSGS